MNAKKLALFGASAVVLGGGLVYALGIFPPASGRDGQGTIGQRQVYRAEQPADADVNPGDAPVVAAANTEQANTHGTADLQNGQMYQMSGQMYQMQNGKMVALQNGQMYQLNNGLRVAMNNGQMYQVKDGLRVAMNNGQFVHQLNNGQVVAFNGIRYQMNNGQMLALQNGLRVQMQNGQLSDGLKMQMQNGRMQNESTH